MNLRSLRFFVTGALTGVLTLPEHPVSNVTQTSGWSDEVEEYAKLIDETEGNEKDKGENILAEMRKNIAKPGTEALAHLYAECL